VSIVSIGVAHELHTKTGKATREVLERDSATDRKKARLDFFRICQFAAPI